MVSPNHTLGNITPRFSYVTCRSTPRSWVPRTRSCTCQESTRSEPAFAWVPKELRAPVASCSGAAVMTHPRRTALYAAAGVASLRCLIQAGAMVTSVKSYPIATVRGLTPDDVEGLKRAGIDSTADLLAAAPTPSRERTLANQTGVPADRIREAVNRADLARVSGIGPATADLFEDAGVNSAKELALRNPAALHATLAQHKEAHAEAHGRVPGTATVAALITGAKLTVDAAGPGAPSPAVVEKHLKMAVVRWCVTHAADIPPGANTSYQAQMAMTRAGITELTDPAEDPHAHDLRNFQVFSHPDTVMPGSDMMWFAVFERSTGKFVEAYNFN